MPLFLNESAARRHFKDVLGNANHLIITILVGLFAVEQRLISECPAELRTAWNPKDPAASANRSRVMMLQMSLVRATDALDMYLSLARRKPALIQDTTLQQRMDACGHSVFGKFAVILLDRVPESGKIHIVRGSVIRAKELVLADWQKTLFLRDESPETRGWLLDVMKCVESLGKRDFTLDEVYAFERHLGDLYPGNQNVKPKIRQQLQYLRDRGFIDFVSRGSYRLRA
jgi:hypothetical protein